MPYCNKFSVFHSVLFIILISTSEQFLAQEISDIIIKPLDNVKILNNSQVIVVPDTVSTLTIQCVASCPVQWILEKFRFPTFPDVLAESIDFRNIRSIENVTHQYMAEIIFDGKTKLLTGNYICQCTTENEIQRSIYVYWEGSSKSHLLQDEPSTMEVFRQRNSSWVTLYCGTSLPDLPLYLFKEIDSKYELIKEIGLPGVITRDIDGFHINIDNFQNPFGKYACSTSKFIKLKTNTNFAKYEVFDKFDVEKPLLKLKHINSLDIESHNTIVVEPKDNSLICCSEGPPASPPAQIGFWCENPQKCNYLKYRFVQGHNAPGTNETCSWFTMSRQLSPIAATFRCTTDTVQVEGELIFSLHSDVYLSRDDAISGGLIQIDYINDMNTSKAFIGALLKFSCKKSFYLFSEGIVWEAQFKNTSKIMITHFEMSNPVYALKSISDNELEIVLNDKNIAAILCSAHVWNTYNDWYDSKVDLTLLDSLKPTFNNSGETAVYVGPSDGEVTLSCIVTGIPLPTVEWRRGTSKVIRPFMEKVVQNSVINKIRIKVTEDSSAYIGTYECIGRNLVGESVQTLQLLHKGIDVLLIIGLSVGFGFLFLVILIALIYKIRKQSKALRHLTQAEIEEFEKGNPEALAKWKDDINACTHLLPYNSDYEMQSVDLIVDSSLILGQGAYGIVMKGTVKRGTSDIPVAVKTLKPNEDVEHFKVLLSELKIMAFIGRHKNIVSLIGALSRNIRNRELKIAIEFCDNGNLLDYLKRRRQFFRNTIKTSIDLVSETLYQNAPVINSHTSSDGSYMNSSIVVSELGLTTTNLIIWAIHIANGMEFLGSKKVIHGDLAARNVLLTGDLVAKIGDFGLSKHLFEYSTYKKKTTALLPWKWMAIEALRDMEFSVKSDVWSYGVTLWELFTLGQIPYPGLSWTAEFIYNLENGLRLTKPQHASKEIYEVIINCMRPEPGSRPSFTELKSLLEKQLLV